jgi:RNA polymerase primary sigma factor
MMTEEERAYHACRDRKMLFATDEAGRTLLHIAAQNGKAAICRMYLNAGIDPGEIDKAGRTAGELAKLAGYASLARSLEAAAAAYRTSSNPEEIAGSDRPLDVREQRALIAGDSDVLAGLIAAKRLNSRNAKGDAPLHLAAAGGHFLLCNQLFEAGADATIRNTSGQTPGDMASAAGHLQLADLLRGLSREPPDDGVQSGQLAAPETDGTRGLLSPEIDDVLDALEFDTEKEPAEFHADQGIEAAIAEFIPIPSGSRHRAGDSTDNADWEVPSSLAKVRGSDRVLARPIAGRADVEAPTSDFSSSNGRSSRRPRKLTGTRFAINQVACRRWVREAISSGEACDQAIRDLIGECQGDHAFGELSENIRKVLESAGIQTENSTEAILQIPCPSAVLVDDDDLMQAIEAACTRETVVHGHQSFSVDRATEERLLREISNARHELLQAILDTPALLNAIVLRGEAVLKGDVPPDTFTDLEIAVFEDEAVDQAFTSNLLALREAKEAGIAVGGRARRMAMEALDGLELARSCLSDLAFGTGVTTGSAISRLLEICDRSMEAFLLEHLPFARRETAKMALPDEDPEELFQEAYFAVRRAAERFDPDRGVRFYVYALFWIRQQIGRWRANNMSLIRVPAHRHELNPKISIFRESFFEQFGRFPNHDQISAHLGVSVDAIRSISIALSKPLEFHRTMRGLADSDHSPEDLARQRQSERLIRREMGQLDEREIEILRMRFGIDRDEEMTLEEVGQVYGVTRERIRQIEAKSLKRIGHPGRIRFLRDLL